MVTSGVYGFFHSMTTRVWSGRLRLFRGQEEGLGFRGFRVGSSSSSKGDAENVVWCYCSLRPPGYDRHVVRCVVLMLTPRPPGCDRHVVRYVVVVVVVMVHTPALGPGEAWGV